jgi:quercetin dioxygenase-like cupin family protein
MIIKSVQNVPSEPVNMDGAKNASVRWLITETDGAANFAMRLFELEPNGHTPHHSHSYEHEVYVLEGAGVVIAPDGERPFRAGEVVFVPPNEKHQFRNTSAGTCRFLCLIPSVNCCVR